MRWQNNFEKIKLFYLNIRIVLYLSVNLGIINFKTYDMKTLIQNTETKEYYAVQCSDNAKGYLTSANDEGNPSENDFPYWTDDIDEAYDFGTKGMAEHEMKCNDVTESGAIEVAIIED